MLTRIVDLMTLANSRYVKSVEPHLWRLLQFPLGHILISKFPKRAMDTLTTAVSRLQQRSNVVSMLENHCDELIVAQIGGITRTFFDNSKQLVRFNTHDWRSGADSEDSSEYVHIKEGTSLPWEDNYFDVVVSRHVLEHISNPIAAINEWTRILKPGAYLYISVPDRRKTTERRRTLTSIEHFIEDFKNNVPEFDVSHEHEIRQTGVGIIQHDKYENPYIHYHTFEAKTLNKLLMYVGLKLVQLTVADQSLFRYQPWDLIVLAQKSPSVHKSSVIESYGLDMK